MVVREEGHYVWIYNDEQSIRLNKNEINAIWMQLRDIDKRQLKHGA